MKFFDTIKNLFGKKEEITEEEKILTEFIEEGFITEAEHAKLRKIVLKNPNLAKDVYRKNSKKSGSYARSLIFIELMKAGLGNN